MATEMLLLLLLSLLLLLLFCFNYVPNQIEKFLEETQAVCSLDAVKTTLRRLRYFKITLPLL